MQSRRKFILLAFILNSLIICSVDNGCFDVFLKYVFNCFRLKKRKKKETMGDIPPCARYCTATSTDEGKSDIL
jgi:hypothetical protein